MAITRLKQLGWFAGLWLASVAAIGIVAYGLRWLLHP
jgi:hypothetical protein